MRRVRALPLVSLTLATLTAMPGCGSRPAVWDAEPIAPVAAYGLDGALALVDPGAERVLMAPVQHDLTLTPTSLPLRRGFAGAATTPDGQRLLVLTHGDVPRTKPTDQGPTLAVLTGGVAPSVADAFDLGDPLSGLAVDPAGSFAVVYPSAADLSFVQNPNELSVVDLTREHGPQNPTPLTLRSFGGRPQSFFFTPTIRVPGGPRRLLAVLTDRDVGIIDLRSPAKGDITVRLSSTGEKRLPAQIAVSDGDPTVPDDARLAIRVDGDPSVILVDLLPVPPDQAAHSAHDFRPTPNVVFAGGVPSDISFVSTDGGLRLAALVPSQSALTLVDPASGIATSVALGEPFERMSLVTSVVDPGASGDVALLWSTSSSSIAFVALGSTVGKPYKSVERLQLEQPVASVIDVPRPNDHLKILAAQDGQTFLVLDLVARTASPILASGGGARLTVAPDGGRAWIIAPGAPFLARLNLSNLHPRNLTLGLDIERVFDVARQGGGRALLALHGTTDLGLTVLDGDQPSLDTAVEYSSLLLGALP